MARKPIILTVLGLTIFALLAVGAGGAGDNVLDAKRKLARELVRDGKYDSAISILTEITDSPTADFRDFQVMAGAQEKAGHQAEALNAYNRVIELLPAPATREEKLAKTEAERHTKTANQMTDKVNVVVNDMLKKLSSLEREASAANDNAALDELFRLRGSIYRSTQDPDNFYAEVAPGPGQQWTNIHVVAGQRYHVLARGKWRLGHPGHPECGPDGLKGEMSANLISGSLTGITDKSDERFQLGRDVTFTATTTGHFLMYSNDNPNEYRKDASGMVYVIIHHEGGR